MSIWSAAFALIFGDTPTPTPVPTPVPTPMPTSMSTFRTTMLAWLGGLSGNHCISTQYIMGGGSASLTSPNAIHNITGQFVGGLAGSYYDDSGQNSNCSLEPTNTLMINWWNAGGVVVMNQGTPNPSAIASNSGNTGALNTNVNVGAILTPGTADNKAWIGVMTQIATGFMILQNAGVPIIWRPLQEMNGNWNWWGTGISNADFVSLWKMWYNFNAAFGLQNLIYVYSSNGGDLSRYPGDAYVDVVGFDAYTSNPTPSSTGYNTFLSPNSGVGFAATKPIAYTEFGPNGPSSGDPNFNLATLTNALSGPMNRCVFWTQWGLTSGGQAWGIDNTSNASAAMNNPYIWNRGNTAAPRPGIATPVPTPTPTFTESADGTTITKTTDPAIVNSFGERWTLVASGNGQVAVNGITDTTTSDAVKLVYWKHLTYHENTSSQWYSKFRASAVWLQTTAPAVPTPTPTPVPTPIPTPTPTPVPVVTHVTAQAQIDAMMVALVKLRTDVGKLTP